MRRSVLILVVGMVLGAAVTVAGIQITTGWYEYRILTTEIANSVKQGNWERWEPVSGTQGSVQWVRRPLFKLTW